MRAGHAADRNHCELQPSSFRDGKKELEFVNDLLIKRLELNKSDV